MDLVIDCRADRDPDRAGRRGDLVVLQHLLNPGAELFQLFLVLYDVQCTVVLSHSQHLTCVAGPRGRRDGSARRPCLRLEGRD